VIKVEESESSYQAELAILDPTKCKAVEMKISSRPESCPTEVNVKFRDVDGWVKQ
jgi:hypothetical protein